MIKDDTYPDFSLSYSHKLLETERNWLDQQMTMKQIMKDYQLWLIHFHVIRLILLE